MSDDEFGFDPADTELARRLGAAAPTPGDADEVLARLRPRLTRARRRRQAGFVAIGTATMVLLVGVAFAATGRDNGSDIRVPPAHRSPVTVDSVPSPTTPNEPTTASNGRTTSTTSAPTGPATAATPPRGAYAWPHRPSTNWLSWSTRPSSAAGGSPTPTPSGPGSARRPTPTS